MIEKTPSTSRAAACSLIASLGLLAIAVAVLIPILSGGFPQSPAYKYVYAAGAALCLGAALFNPCASTDVRDRRWHRIEGWSAIFFCAAAVFAFMPDGSPRDWLAFTLAGAAIRIICFFRNVRTISKKAPK